jgi:hypothetical protein
MSIVPYKPDLEAYRKHFRNLDSTKKFHKVEKTKRPDPTEEKTVVVNLVSPTQQTVERAEALVAREKKDKKKKKKKTPW